MGGQHMSNIMTIWLVVAATLAGGWLGHNIRNYLHEEEVYAGHARINAFGIGGGFVGGVIGLGLCLWYLH